MNSCFVSKYIVIKFLSTSFVFFFLNQVLFSQDKNTLISGLIKNTSFVGAENVHIINLNTKKGVITNAEGFFKINATKGDSLLISNIQYQKERIKITSKIIEDKKLEIYLLVAVNQLKEVILKKKLISVLEIDIHKKPKDTITKMTFQMPNFSEEYLGQVDMGRSMKPKNSRYLTDPTSKVMGIGINAGIPDNSSRKLRILRRKLAFKKSFPLKVRLEFGDDFFFKKLKIPKDRFYHFLGYCNPLGIEDLYKQGKVLEVIKILQEESKSYLKIIENKN